MKTFNSSQQIQSTGFQSPIFQIEPQNFGSTLSNLELLEGDYSIQNSPNSDSFIFKGPKRKAHFKKPIFLFKTGRINR